MSTKTDTHTKPDLLLQEEKWSERWKPPANSCVSLSISPELDKKLESLANKTGRTKDEILLGGISLIELAVKAKEEGKKFGVAEQDQKLITEVVL
jgi:predicted transcriptional regulator